MRYFKVEAKLVGCIVEAEDEGKAVSIAVSHIQHGSWISRLHFTTREFKDVTLVDGVFKGKLILAASSWLSAAN